MRKIAITEAGAIVFSLAKRWSYSKHYRFSHFRILPPYPLLSYPEVNKKGLRVSGNIVQTLTA
jgi:hypothetical protein